MFIKKGNSMATVVAKKSRKKGNTGKRYSKSQKKIILNFVKSRGRGGISAACKKFGVSYVALKRWMNGNGVEKKLGRPAKVKSLDGRKLKSVHAAMSALKALKKQLGAVQKTLKKLM